VNRAGFADKPKIMETPKGVSDGGKAWDTLNLKRLKSLMNAPRAEESPESGRESGGGVRTRGRSGRGRARV
jgi:hypothetical protein